MKKRGHTEFLDEPQPSLIESWKVVERKILRTKQSTCSEQTHAPNRYCTSLYLKSFLELLIFELQYHIWEKTKATRTLIWKAHLIFCRKLSLDHSAANMSSALTVISSSIQTHFTSAWLIKHYLTADKMIHLSTDLLKHSKPLTSEEVNDWMSHCSLFILSIILSTWGVGW